MEVKEVPNYKSTQISLWLPTRSNKCAFQSNFTNIAYLLIIFLPQLRHNTYCKSFVFFKLTVHTRFLAVFLF